MTDLPEAMREGVDDWVERMRADGQLEPSPSNKCRVCRDPEVRDLVNRLLAVGFRVPDVLHVLRSHNDRMRAERKPLVTKDSLYNHRQRHFDVQRPAAAIYRQIQEQAALKYGDDWREGVGTVLNAVSYYHTMMVKGYETLVDPAYVVDPMDGAKAAHALHNIARQDEDAYDRAEQRAKMGRIIEVIRHFIPKEQWPQIQAMLTGNEDIAAAELEPGEGAVMIDIDDSPDAEE